MKRILFACVLACTASCAIWAQATAGFGNISGTVRDPSGSVIPGATVSVTNPALGLTRELTTTEGGIFAAPALVPGPGYKVTVSREGFAPFEAPDLVVQVGETVNLNITLSVGQVTQSVNIEAAAPVVDDVKTEVSQVVGNQQINDLPINGRRVDQFVLLTPAVTKDADFGLLTFRGI